MNSIIFPAVLCEIANVFVQSTILLGTPKMEMNFSRVLNITKELKNSISLADLWREEWNHYRSCCKELDTKSKLLFVFVKQIQDENIYHLLIIAVTPNEEDRSVACISAESETVSLVEDLVECGKIHLFLLYLLLFFLQCIWII